MINKNYSVFFLESIYVICLLFLLRRTLAVSSLLSLVLSTSHHFMKGLNEFKAQYEKLIGVFIFL